MIYVSLYSPGAVTFAGEIWNRYLAVIPMLLVVSISIIAAVLVPFTV